MSLLARKKRPIRRDEGSLRDDRLFIIACDDKYAPKQYFDCFQIPRVQVHVIPTEDSACGAEHVLERLLKFESEEDDERWLVLDTDHYVKKTHLKTFTRVIKEAKDAGVQLALSRSCFEIWLLLHHVEEQDVVSLRTANQALKLLQKVLSGYDKTRLNPEDYTLDGVIKACQRAERLDATVAGGDIPIENTSRVYLIWKSIVRKALRSQLPEELAALGS